MFAYIYEENLTLRDWFDLSTVNELKSLIEILDLPVRKSGRKAELIDGVVGCFMSPNFMIQRISYYEAAFIKTILGNPEKEFTQSDVFLLPDGAFTNTGVIQVVEISDSKRRFHVMPELADVYRRYFEREYNAADFEEEYTIQRLLLGYANICGTISFTDMLDLSDSKGSPISPYHYPDLLQQMSRLRGCGNHDNMSSTVGWGMLSPFSLGGMAENTKEPTKTILRRLTVPELLAAAEMPFPQAGVSLTEYRNLMEFLTVKEKMSNSKARRLMSELWATKQIPVSVSSLISTTIQAYAIRDVQRYVGLLTEYTNAVPYWKFQGRSSKEIFEKEEKPKLKPLSAFSTNMLGGMNPFIRPEAKIGRNGPCPCGSGKKYKNCCGRN